MGRVPGESTGDRKPTGERFLVIRQYHDLAKGRVVMLDSEEGFSEDSAMWAQRVVCVKPLNNLQILTNRNGVNVL